MLAHAIAEGARKAGAEVDIKRVPETVADEAVRHVDLDSVQGTPLGRVEDLVSYDAIIIGTPTHFGALGPEMTSFLNAAAGLYARGALNGIVGGAFTAVAKDDGEQEKTLLSILATLLNFGMVVVGIDYGLAGQAAPTEALGGSSYGSTTITGGHGTRMPWDSELAGARYQGHRIAETAKRLADPERAGEARLSTPQGSNMTDLTSWLPD